MFELSSWQSQKIHDFQRSEIARLASDRQFAVDCAKLEHSQKLASGSRRIDRDAFLNWVAVLADTWRCSHLRVMTSSASTLCLTIPGT